MQIHPPDAAIANDAKGAAIALGNFDGVHRGHQAVIASAREAAGRLGAPLSVAVFRPHPRRFFQPDAPPFRLQSANQRARALAALDVDHLYEIGFDRARAQSSDAAFAANVLRGGFGARHVSVGADFRFGRGRMGDVESLTRLGAANGFSVTAVAPVGDAAGERVSSSAIRAALSRGDVAGAGRLLGRPWAIEGEVARGFARGRDLGFPTANIPLGDYQQPRLGIYAVRVDLGDGVQRPGVASIGVNPTTGALPLPLLETHLFDFDSDLYGRVIETALIAFLRPEEKFETIDVMRRQMDRDAEAARALLA